MSTPIWTTAQGLIGVYPAQVSMTYQLNAAPVDFYTIISGELPSGLTFRDDGLIYGTPDIVSKPITSTFVVRASYTDTLTSQTSIKDRTFELTITGIATPSFTTPGGSLGEIIDSTWQEIPIEYNNPIESNPISIRVAQGSLPPGLEINEYGLIRGYPQPPTVLTNFSAKTTIATATSATTNYVTVLSTYNMFVGRSIIFTGTPIGNIISGKTYFVKSVVDATNIQLSEIPFGDMVVLTSGIGFMDVSLPATQVGQPTKRQYSFTLEISSPLGNNIAAYSFTVINYYLPPSQGGPIPANAYDSRIPVIYNTRPPTYDIQASQNYGYFVLPPSSDVAVPGTTYDPAELAYMGEFLSGEYTAFKIIGHDFDGDDLVYDFSAGLPAGLTGDSTTGWIYGTPMIVSNPIEAYSFTVQVKKQNKPLITSVTYNFSLEVTDNISGKITWITDSDLGTINNATNCYSFVEAACDLDLEYELISGELPPNLTLTTTGLIQGIVSYQPTDAYQDKDSQETFTFTVRAYNPGLSSIVSSDRTFTLTVNYYYDIPTDSLYFKCTPSIADRNILRTLLDDNSLIPTDYIYRPTDPNFGKATDVTVAYAYGIYANDIDAYIAATQKNHYWRNVTLGQLKTASAKDENGNIIYEVVYSDVIDNLLNYDPNYNYDYRYSVSIPEEIFWPRPIDLQTTPWYTSTINVYTSYIYPQNTQLISNFTQLDLLTQINQTIETQQGQPTYYTSLDTQYVYTLYPNSLENMGKRVGQNLGVNYNYRILPLWMTSQQSDGNTLGFTPAWVIAYTKPPVIKTAIADITYDLTDKIELDDVENLQIGGKVVFTGNTFGGIIAEVTYFVKSIDTITKTITVSETINGETVNLTNAAGIMKATFEISYAEIVKNNIEVNWNYTLNEINFEIDRFTVNKQLTYNYDSELDPGTWTRMGTMNPTPYPIDSENFYVLFPQKTILPK